MNMKAALIVFAGLLAAGCGVQAGGPPQIVVDRTACSHCGMLISEPLYAAAYQAPEADGRVFDDIGCLLEAARAEPGGGLRFWFHDAAAGGWMEGTAAVFVASPAIRTPMGGGVIAYRDPAAAELAAERHRGEIVRSLPELLARKGGKS